MEAAEAKSLNLSSLVKGVFFDEGILAKVFFNYNIFTVERLDVFTWQAQRVLLGAEAAAKGITGSLL